MLNSETSTDATPPSKDLEFSHHLHTVPKDSTNKFYKSHILEAFSETSQAPHIPHNEQPMNNTGEVGFTVQSKAPNPNNLIEIQQHDTPIHDSTLNKDTLHDINITLNSDIHNSNMSSHSDFHNSDISLHCDMSMYDDTTKEAEESIPFAPSPSNQESVTFPPSEPQSVFECLSSTQQIINSHADSELDVKSVPQTSIPCESQNSSSMCDDEVFSSSAETPAFMTTFKTATSSSSPDSHLINSSNTTFEISEHQHSQENLQAPNSTSLDIEESSSLEFSSIPPHKTLSNETVNLHLSSSPSIFSQTLQQTFSHDSPFPLDYSSSSFCTKSQNFSKFPQDLKEAINVDESDNQFSTAKTDLLFSSESPLLDPSVPPDDLSDSNPINSIQPSLIDNSSHEISSSSMPISPELMDITSLEIIPRVEFHLHQSQPSISDYLMSQFSLPSNSSKPELAHSSSQIISSETLQKSISLESASIDHELQHIDSPTLSHSESTAINSETTIYDSNLSTHYSHPTSSQVPLNINTDSINSSSSINIQPIISDIITTTHSPSTSAEADPISSIQPTTSSNLLLSSCATMISSNSPATSTDTPSASSNLPDTSSNLPATTSDLPATSSVLPASSSDRPSTSSDSEVKQSDTSPKNENSSQNSFECNICLDDVTDPVVTVCGHLFCWECLHKCLERDIFECPVCKSLIDESKIIPLYGRGQDASTRKSSNATKRPLAKRVEAPPSRRFVRTGVIGGWSFSFEFFGLSSAFDTPSDIRRFRTVPGYHQTVQGVHSENFQNGPFNGTRPFSNNFSELQFQHIPMIFFVLGLSLAFYLLTI